MSSQLFFKKSFRNLVLFVFFFLMVALSCGLSILMGPVHVITDWIEFHKWGQMYEDRAIQIVIILYLVFTVLVASWLVRIENRCISSLTKGLLFVICILVGSFSTWAMFQPGSFDSIRANTTLYNAHIAFGGYPSKSDMYRLKQEGYNAIISTLAPDFVPFEKPLLDQEIKNANDVGLELIHLPLLPWINIEGNQHSLDEILRITKDTTKRFYIHCYLGKDRNGLVARLLEKESPSSKVVFFTSPRSLESSRRVESGPIIHLDKGVAVVPLLNQEDLLGLIISGQQVEVVILSDEDTAWADPVKKDLETYQVPLTFVVVPSQHYNPELLFNLASEVKEIKGPVTIVFKSIASSLAKGFINAYESKSPSFISSLFLIPLDEGSASLISKHLVVGPRPRLDEFNSYLLPRGVKGVLFLGDPLDPVALEDAKVAEAQGFLWKAIDKPFSLITKEITEGLWYSYGPNYPKNLLALVNQFENGPIYRLNTNLFLIPNPTSAESEKYLSDGTFKTVLKIENIDHYDPNAILELVNTAWAQNEPTLIQIPDTNSYLAEAIRQAYFSNTPPLPPSIFKGLKFEDQPVFLAGPNIAVGPGNLSREFKDLLYEKGIRKFATLDIEGGDTGHDQTLTTSSYAIKCKSTVTPECIYNNLFSGGPWYISPESEKTKVGALFRILEARLGPVMPNRVLYYPFQEGLQKTLNQRATSLVYCEGCLSNYLPSLNLAILLIPFLLLYTLWSSWFVGWLKTTKGLSSRYTRKIYHLLVFSMGIFLQMTLHFPSVLLFGFVVAGSVLYALLEKEKLAFYDALISEKDSDDQGIAIFFGLIATAIGGLTSYIFFGHYYLFGLAICGYGDAAAALVGYYGRHRYLAPSMIGRGSQKSWEGSFAMWVAGSLICILMLLVMGAGFMTALYMGLIIGFIGAFVEGLSSSRIDNLTVQFFVSGVAYYLVPYGIGV